MENPHWKEMINSAFSSLAFAPVLFLNSLVMFVINMIPRDSHRLLGKYASDGRQLLQLLRPGEAYVDKALEGAFVAESVYAESLNDYIHAENVCRSGLARYPESKMLANSPSVVLINTGQYEEGRKLLVGLLAVTRPGEDGEVATGAGFKQYRLVEPDDR